MAQRNSHCSWCGAPFAQNDWPRTCAACQNTSYLNPLPVAVALVPIDGSLLVVRRGIEPKKGELALPGGFIEIGESWQQACARELFEETGVVIDPATVAEHAVLSAPDGTVLIFGIAPPAGLDLLEGAIPTEEATEWLLLTSLDEPLAFPLHTEAARRFFES